MSKLALLAAVLIGAVFCAAGCATSNPATQAMDRDDMTVLRSILESGYDVNQPVWNGNFNLMDYAACKGYDEAIKVMLARGADVNKGHEYNKKYGTYNTPLMRAIQCNASATHPSTVRLLLDNGARVDPVSLAMASTNYNDRSITKMIREAAELQSQGKSAALQAEAHKASATANLQHEVANRRREDALTAKGWAKSSGNEKLDAAISAALAARGAAPGNTDDAAYDRMRSAAGMAPEKRAPASDVDAPAKQGAERPDDFALVIGVDEYQSLPKADYGVRDAQTVRKHLEALGFPARNIISLEGPQATGNKLKSYLEEWLPLNVKPTSTLFVYYSGHGAPDPQSGDAYLVPWDGDATFLKSTAYPLKKFYADLSKTKAKRVIVALDACFSGAGGRSVLAQGARPLVAKVAEVSGGERVTVLAAASGEEITGSLNEQGHGMFTYFLLKGLAEGKRTAKELHSYLTPRVQDEARRQNRQQTPALIGADAPF